MSGKNWLPINWFCYCDFQSYCTKCMLGSPFFRMCRALMPGDEESMSDEAIWETLPVSLNIIISSTVLFPNPKDSNNVPILQIIIMKYLHLVNLNFLVLFWITIFFAFWYLLYQHFWVAISMVFFIAATTFTLLKLCGNFLFSYENLGLWFLWN